MEENSNPEVASFLIRFVREQTDFENETRIHCVIKHVQTGHEQTFTCWDGVEAFIQQVIPLKLIDDTKGEDHEVER